jgi:hypothetical protein
MDHRSLPVGHKHLVRLVLALLSPTRPSLDATTTKLVVCILLHLEFPDTLRYDNPHLKPRHVLADASARTGQESTEGTFGQGNTLLGRSGFAHDPALGLELEWVGVVILVVVLYSSARSQMYTARNSPWPKDLY